MVQNSADMDADYRRCILLSPSCSCHAGPAVEELHCFLLAEGYMPADDTVAHHFYDARTAQAVAAWQRDHGVLATERPGDFGHLSRQAYLSMLVTSASLTAGRC